MFAACDHPGTDGVQQVLEAGRSRLFTIAFRLPHDCAQPLPVEAAYGWT
jgi:hypothetical protein